MLSIKGGAGSFNAFNNPTIAKAMNTLPSSVQLVIVSQATSQKQVEFILSCITQTKSITASENESFTYANSGETVTAHTLQKHVGKSDDYLIDRASKGKASDGVPFASTFPDEATALWTTSKI